MKVLSLFLALIVSYSVQATSVEGFSLAGLDEYKGMNVSLYYVSGRPAGLGTAGQEIHANKVLLGPQKFSIPSSGVVSVPKVEVPRDGFTSFNFLIVVVHQQADHALTNPALRGGRVVREPVRYLNSGTSVTYNDLTQGFVFKTFKPLAQVLSGGYIDL
jgi:hypothetical protein